MLYLVLKFEMAGFASFSYRRTCSNSKGVLEFLKFQQHFMLLVTYVVPIILHVEQGYWSKLS